MRLLLCVALCVGLGGCSPSEQQAPPIPEETFARLYAKLLTLSDEDTTPSLAENPAGLEADSILAREGVTREAYMETVRWYNEDVTRWRGLLSRIVSDLERRAQRADSVLTGASGRNETSRTSPPATPPHQ